MTSMQKRKGDRAEIAVRNVLRVLGFPWAERTRAGHPDDHGDIWAAMGLMVQVKDQAASSYGVWLRETEEQRVAGGADHAVLVHKRRGESDPAQWYAVLTVEQYARLARAAGYGQESLL